MTRRFISTVEDDLREFEALDFSSGYNSYDANDVVKPNQLVYATDTRISTLGRQKTRQGCDFLSVPAGETVDAQQATTTGAADQSVGTALWLAKKWTATATGRCTKLELRVKNASGATGPILVSLYSDASGSPGTLLGQSSIPADTPTSSYAYVAARFIEAPQVVNGTSYWTVAHVQDDGAGSYAWSSTTNATTAKASTNGTSWSSSSFDLNHKAYISTDSPTLGRFEAVKSDGTIKWLIAYKEVAGTTAVAVIDQVTGALTAIKTGLSSSATRYDFEQVQDVVYYVNGYDAPRKWDFTNESATTGMILPATRLKWHKNHLFMLLASDPAQVVFSDTAAPESFTSTSFLYIPAPKSNDAVVNWWVLNDNLYFFTRKTKWPLYGSDLSNFVIRQAPGTKGLVSPDALCGTRNHAYFPSDDGFYRFNGSTDELLSEKITGEYAAATNRINWGGCIAGSRYYVFYTPSGGAQNSQCWVYNINYDSMESNDTAAYVQKCDVWSGKMVQCSNVVAAVYYGERLSNSYNTLGYPLDWEIRPRYEYYRSPAALKELEQWFPRFAAQGGNYSVLAQYDFDFLNSPVSIPVPLQSSGFVWDDPGTIWDSFTWDELALINPELTMDGEAMYIQRRYKRTGVNTPVEFLGESQYYSIRKP
jgi:hypothetical protein